LGNIDPPPETPIPCVRFFLAILNEWHVFSHTKLCTIFRNIFMLYNNMVDVPIKDLQKLYGLECMKNNISLYNDLIHAKQPTNVIYLHECTIYKRQLDIFIKEMENKEYTYKEAYNKLLVLYNSNNLVSTEKVLLKEKKGGDWGNDPDECVIYHSDRK
jgi:hypothetical protein